MKLKDGADIKGLHILMRKVLREAEKIWKENGISDGITITAGLDGVHSAASWHYYGLAVDLRTNYFDENKKQKVFNALKSTLPEYDIVLHSTHIHVEPGNNLAQKHGLLI